MCIQYKTLVLSFKYILHDILKNSIIVRHNTRLVIIPGSTLYMYTFEWTVDTAVELMADTCSCTCTCRLYF